jgi:hypothetical protein
MEPLLFWILRMVGTLMASTISGANGRCTLCAETGRCVTTLVMGSFSFFSRRPALGDAA